MSTYPTYCRDCENVHSDTRRLDPWQWRCLRAPIQGGFGYVDPDYAPNPPYALCKHTNLVGECPLFSPLPQPNGINEPKTRQFEQHRREMNARRA